MTYNPYAVQRVALFEGLSNQEGLLLFETSDHLEAKTGESILKEGDISNSLFAILTGSFQVLKQKEGERKEKLIATLGAGDFFGEMALLETSMRFATVRAVESSTLLEFKKYKLEELFTKHPVIAWKVYCNLAKELSARLRKISKLVLLE